MAAAHQLQTLHHSTSATQSSSCARSLISSVRCVCIICVHELCVHDVCMRACQCIMCCMRARCELATCAHAHARVRARVLPGCATRTPRPRPPPLTRACEAGGDGADAGQVLRHDHRCDDAVVTLAKEDCVICFYSSVQESARLAQRGPKCRLTLKGTKSKRRAYKDTCTVAVHSRWCSKCTASVLDSPARGGEFALPFP